MPGRRCSRTASALLCVLPLLMQYAVDLAQGACVRQTSFQPAAGCLSSCTAPFLPCAVDPPCAVVLQASTLCASCVSACMALQWAVQLLTWPFPARSTYELRYFNIADNEGEEEE